MPARRAAPKRMRHVLHHLPGRHGFLAGQHEGLPDRRRVHGSQDEPLNQIANVDGLTQIQPVANDHESAAIERAEQFEQAIVARSVGLGYSHDAGFKVAALRLDHLFRGKLAAAVNIHRLR